MKSRRGALTLALLAATVAVLLVVGLAGRARGGKPADLDARTREIASALACPVCQGLSVADSPSELAVNMRQVIRSKLEAGESRQEIVDYFVQAYGESILLAPPRSGFWLFIWWVPVVVIAAGLCCVGFAVTRWASRGARQEPALPELTSEERGRYEARLGEIVAPEGPGDAIPPPPKAGVR